MTPINNQFSDLSNELTAMPGVRTDLEYFPSGELTLAVWVGDRFFIMDYLPSYGGIGVDEVLDNEAFLVGYHHWFAEFDDASLKLLSMIDDVTAAPP